MDNANNFRWGFPLPANPKGGEKAHLLMGMTTRLKTVSNLPVVFPEYGMTNANNFRWGLPPGNNCQRGETRVAFINGNDAKVKHSV